MSREQKINSFDPNSAASADGGIFGLPFSTDEAQIVLIPVPWDVTVSYKDGASKGPQAILDASAQVDLFDPLVKDCWKTGVAMEEISKDIAKKNAVLRKKAAAYIAKLEKGVPEDSTEMKKTRKEVNAGCTDLKYFVKKAAQKHMGKNKLEEKGRRHL